MTTEGGSSVLWRGLSLAEGGLLLALLVGLGVQHFRHGWPFSAHHGMDPRGAPVARAASLPSRVGADPHAAHAVPGRVAVSVDPSRLGLAGDTYATVSAQQVARPVRAVATVALDEGRVSHVHARVSGWVERLNVSTTGQRVAAGAALMTIFSQELLASQTEFLSVRQAMLSMGAGPDQSRLLDASRGRLRVLGMAEGEIASIERSGRPIRNITVFAPRAGVVLHRGVSAGTSVDASTELLTLADLTRVWALAEVPEADIPGVAAGSLATLDFPASGAGPIESPVSFLYPTLDERTRTLRARFELPNPEGRLRPGMYGTAEIRAAPREALVIPLDAVVDTGTEQHVFVPGEHGAFTPRRVVLGARLGELVEVREGLDAGERVLASGVFLIDSESRIRASSTGGGGAPAGHAGH